MNIANANRRFAVIAVKELSELILRLKFMGDFIFFVKKLQNCRGQNEISKTATSTTHVFASTFLPFFGTYIRKNVNQFGDLHFFLHRYRKMEEM